MNSRTKQLGEEGWAKNLMEEIEKLGLLLPYLLTPWSRVLLEKLTCLQLVKKFPAFY
jgi:hypothetical protein